MFEDTIPGWLFHNEPNHLYNLTKIYNRDSAIGVEIGSMHGRSAAIIAQAIHRGTLYCIDIWDNGVNRSNLSDETLVKGSHPLNGAINSLDYFLSNTSKYSNIKAIQGQSPHCVQWWSEAIDFVFLDASHTNPSDREIINFFLPFIRSGGSFMGHDYDLGQFPDVVENVHYLENLLGQKASLYDSIWSIKVP